MHHGDKDFTLDCSPLLGLGSAVFLVLFNKVFSVPPRKARSRHAKESPLPPFLSNGIVRL